MSIQINDLRSSLKLSDCILFADDTTLFVFGQNVKFLYVKMLRELGYLSTWLNANKLAINVKKTKSMLISPKSYVTAQMPKN